MLPSIRTLPAEFGSPQAALDFLDKRVEQRVVVPLRDLRVDPHGRLTHVGVQPIGDLQRLPLTEGALHHLDRFAGIPKSFSLRIDERLHVTNLHEQLGGHLGVVTVHLEHERGDKDRRTVTAVTRGARGTVPHTVVLQRLADLGVDAAVRLHGGLLDARFGDALAVNVLPGDTMHVRGALRNDAWGDDTERRPLLDVSVYLLRLICANGAYAERRLAGARALSWGSTRHLVDFVSHEVERVLSFSSARLEDAVHRMVEELPTDQELEGTRRVITRHTSTEVAAEVLRDVTSRYDECNAITGAAHRAATEAGRRRLQIAGGALVDRYLQLRPS